MTTKRIRILVTALGLASSVVFLSLQLVRMFSRPGGLDSLGYSLPVLATIVLINVAVLNIPFLVYALFMKSGMTTLVVGAILISGLWWFLYFVSTSSSSTAGLVVFSLLGIDVLALGGGGLYELLRGDSEHPKI